MIRRLVVVVWRRAVLPVVAARRFIRRSAVAWPATGAPIYTAGAEIATAFATARWPVLAITHAWTATSAEYATRQFNARPSFNGQSGLKRNVPALQSVLHFGLRQIHQDFSLISAELLQEKMFHCFGIDL